MYVVAGRSLLVCIDPHFLKICIIVILFIGKPFSVLKSSLYSNIIVPDGIRPGGRLGHTDVSKWTSA